MSTCGIPSTQNTIDYEKNKIEHSPRRYSRATFAAPFGRACLG